MMSERANGALSTDYMANRRARRHKLENSIGHLCAIVMAKYLFLSIVGCARTHFCFYSSIPTRFPLFLSLAPCDCKQINKSHYRVHCFFFLSAAFTSNIDISFDWANNEKTNNASSSNSSSKKCDTLAHSKGAECDAHCDGNHQVKYLLLGTVHLLEHLALVSTRYSHGNFVKNMFAFFRSCFSIYMQRTAEKQSE